MGQDCCHLLVNCRCVGFNAHLPTRMSIQTHHGIVINKLCEGLHEGCICGIGLLSRFGVPIRYRRDLSVIVILLYCSTVWQKSRKFNPSSQKRPASRSTPLQSSSLFTLCLRALRMPKKKSGMSFWRVPIPLKITSSPLKRTLYFLILVVL